MDTKVATTAGTELWEARLGEQLRRASDEGRTQSSLIEEAIRQLLRDEPPPGHRPMPTFGESGRNALLVDLADKDALNAILDDEDVA